MLIGHSLGGMVGLELAARVPDRVAGLVLVEAVPAVRTSLFTTPGAFLATVLMRALGPRGIAWLSSLGQTETTAAELKRQLSKVSRETLKDTVRAAFDYDGRKRLHEIRCPTLVIVGAANNATHRGAPLAADAIPCARFVTLPGGHMLHTDCPDALTTAVTEFVTGLEYSPACSD